MTQPVIFISYNHKDEREKNRLLSHLGVLQRQGLIGLWSDDRIGVGADWEQEINEAVAQAKVAILLISANFLTSDFILGEEVPALLKRRNSEGLTVFPVIAKACAWQEVDWLTGMNVRPKNGRPIWGGGSRRVDEDLAAIAQEVAAIVKTGSPMTPRVSDVFQSQSETPLLGYVPPFPPLVIGREKDMQEMKARFGISTDKPRQPLTIIRGWPGVGKTTLISALAYDSEVLKTFSDGILWAFVGENSNPLSQLADWGIALGVDNIGHVRTIQDAMAQMRALLANKRMLLVVDDIWEAKDAAPFKVAGPECVTIITTRFSSVAHELATTSKDIYLLEQLDEDKGFELLQEVSPTVSEEQPKKMRQLVNDLEGLPLALRVAGRLLESEWDMGWGIDDLLEDLAKGKILHETAPDDRLDPITGTIPTVSILLKKSTDRLDQETRDYFAFLGVFAPKPATFNLEAMQAAWMVEDAKPIARKLVDRGLLEPIGSSGRFQMHALLVMHANSLFTE